MSEGNKAISGEGFRAFPSKAIPCTWTTSVRQRVEGLLETVGVGTLRFGQRLEPVRDFVETFVAGALGHAGIHVGVLVSFAGDRRLQIIAGTTDRQAGGRIAGPLPGFEMAVPLAG